MTELHANLLLDRIRRESRWPLPFEERALKRILRWAAFRESDRDALRSYHLVNGKAWPEDRTYYLDPLAPRISEAYADLLFSEDPALTPANERDADNLKRIVEESDLPSELHYAEQIASSEGEVWWRVMAAPGLLPCPVITFHSREELVPLFIGPTLAAVAFVSEFDAPDAPRSEGSNPRVYRHLEIQTQGRIENRLYLGRRTSLGDEVDLEDFSETAELPEVWDHGLPLICAGRILNKRGRDRRHGRSDYEQIEDLLFALNEALTIGAENVRLVAKQRAVVPTSAVGPAQPELEDGGDGTLVPTGRSRFNAGDDVFTVDPMDADLGKESAGLFKVLEYSFDADQLVAWQNKIAKVAASRAGLTAQLVGEGDGFEGEASSGTALRVRLLPAIGSGRGRGRAWDDQIPRALMAAQLLDALPPGSLGHGRTWSAAGEPPAFERTDPLPRDTAEETTVHVTAVTGEIEARRTAVEALHPDWDDARVEQELDDIRQDGQDRARSMGFGTPPAPDDPGSEGGEEPPGL